MVLIFLVGMLASLLTYFTSFGLGSILMPAMAAFMPLELAIASTALVHLLHNLLKGILLREFIEWKQALPFALAAWVSAPIGAILLVVFSSGQPILTYTIWDRSYTLAIFNILVGLLMISFVLVPKKCFSFLSENYLLGGSLSGFLGGISGYQGAFRSACLVNLQKSMASFVGTSAMVSGGIDLVRLMIYFPKLSLFIDSGNLYHVLSGILGALLGVFIGQSLIHKASIEWLQKIISFVLCFMGVFIAAGWI